MLVIGIDAGGRGVEVHAPDLVEIAPALGDGRPVANQLAVRTDMPVFPVFGNRVPPAGDRADRAGFAVDAPEPASFAEQDVAVERDAKMRRRADGADAARPVQAGKGRILFSHPGPEIRLLVTGRPDAVGAQIGAMNVRVLAMRHDHLAMQRIAGQHRVERHDLARRQGRRPRAEPRGRYAPVRQAALVRIPSAGFRRHPFLHGNPWTVEDEHPEADAGCGPVGPAGHAEPVPAVRKACRVEPERAGGRGGHRHAVGFELVRSRRRRRGHAVRRVADPGEAQLDGAPEYDLVLPALIALQPVFCGEDQGAERVERLRRKTEVPAGRLGG